jgi:hypothetical protein
VDLQQLEVSARHGGERALGGTRTAEASDSECDGERKLLCLEDARSIAEEAAGQADRHPTHRRALQQVQGKDCSLYSRCSTKTEIYRYVFPLFLNCCC